MTRITVTMDLLVSLEAAQAARPLAYRRAEGGNCASACTCVSLPLRLLLRDWHYLCITLSFAGNAWRLDVVLEAPAMLKAILHELRILRFYVQRVPASWSFARAA